MPVGQGFPDLFPSGTIPVAIVPQVSICVWWDQGVIEKIPGIHCLVRWRLTRAVLRRRRAGLWRVVVNLTATLMLAVIALMMLAVLAPQSLDAQIMGEPLRHLEVAEARHVL